MFKSIACRNCGTEWELNDPALMPRIAKLGQCKACRPAHVRALFDTVYRPVGATPPTPDAMRREILEYGRRLVDLERLPATVKVVP